MNALDHNNCVNNTLTALCHPMYQATPCQTTRTVNQTNATNMFDTESPKTARQLPESSEELQPWLSYIEITIVEITSFKVRRLLTSCAWPVDE